jgi:F-type H+-transporting ATPase subunit epsilon
MSNKIKLKIVTPEKVVFEGEVEEVLVPGSEGELGILPKHIPLLAALKPGELKIKKEGFWDNFAIMGGFVEVREDNTVTVLAKSGEHAEDIDEARALTAKERAESLLKEAKDEVKFAEDSAALERDITRLKIVQRKRKHKAKSFSQENF